MAWFGKKKEPAMMRVVDGVFDAFQDNDRSAAEAERKAEREAYERAAIAAEAELLIKVPSLNAANEDEHRRQVAGFKFECRRYGDFLALFVERPGKEYPNTEFKQTKLATAVNIAATRELRMDAGHGPDFNGIVTYGMINMYRVGQDRTKKEVSADYERAEYKSRALFKLDQPPHDGSYYGHDSMCAHRTHNFPRPAEDDRIRFEGIGATIYAPFGCGQAAYDAILKEIEAYRETM